jgi:hypothetical protein
MNNSYAMIILLPCALAECELVSSIAEVDAMTTAPLRERLEKYFPYFGS